MTVPELNRREMTKAREFLGNMYTESGRMDKAAEWKAKAQ